MILYSSRRRGAIFILSHSIFLQNEKPWHSVTFNPKASAIDRWDLLNARAAPGWKEGWRGKQRESQRQTSQLDEIQWAVALPSVRRAVATGIIDKASVVVVVIAGKIIEIVAQPLHAERSDVGGYFHTH